VDSWAMWRVSQMLVPTRFDGTFGISRASFTLLYGRDTQLKLGSLVSKFRLRHDWLMSRFVNYKQSLLFGISKRSWIFTSRISRNRRWRTFYDGLVISQSLMLLSRRAHMYLQSLRFPTPSERHTGGRTRVVTKRPNFRPSSSFILSKWPQFVLFKPRVLSLALCSQYTRAPSRALPPEHHNSSPALVLRLYALFP
jgi:hypothetical protein